MHLRFLIPLAVILLLGLAGAGYYVNTTHMGTETSQKITYPLEVEVYMRYAGSEQLLGPATVETGGYINRTHDEAWTPVNRAFVDDIFGKINELDSVSIDTVPPPDARSRLGVDKGPVGKWGKSVTRDDPEFLQALIEALADHGIILRLPMNQPQMSGAVEKICSARTYKLDITAYENAKGEVGGYFVTADPDALVSDESGLLYNAAGDHIGTDSLFQEQEERAAFQKQFDDLRRDFPIKKKLSCPA